MRDDHYCSYHTCKGHKTKDCIAFKCVIQDLIDDKIIDVETAKDLCNEDSSLGQDHVDESMPSDGLIDTSIYFNTYASPKTSKLSNIIPSNKGPNAFHLVPYSYPQGLPLK